MPPSRRRAVPGPSICTRAGRSWARAGGGERALPLGTIGGQNLRGDKAFDPTQRYAVGFDIVPASAAASRLNFDSKNDADYQR